MRASLFPSYLPRDIAQPTIILPHEQGDSRQPHRADGSRQLLRRELSAVLRMVEGRRGARRKTRADVEACPRGAARALPPHSLLPEAMSLLLLPGLHR